jgi:TetR/AcrR family transcriptional regulator, regulator of cefoperazone and chloramphenicol sensitivity
MTSGAIAVPGFEDLTARARIREAAIRLFTERGVKETAVLDIAKAAGVSGGLIRHHFGSKDGLRVECDTYVLDELLRFKEQALKQMQADPDFQPMFDARQVLLRRYLGRAMVDGSPEAAARFVQTVDETEHWFVDQSGLDLPDARACAAVLAGMTLGVFAMQDHIARALGENPLSPRVQERIGQAYAVIYSPVLLPSGITGRTDPSPQPRQRTRTKKKKEDHG